MTFQEILQEFNRRRLDHPETRDQTGDLQWAVQSILETLRDREQELSAIAPHERAGHASDALPDDPPWDEPDEVDDAFDEFEKRK